MDANEGRILILDAPGVIGKTYLIDLHLAKVRSTYVSEGSGINFRTLTFRGIYF